MQTWEFELNSDIRTQNLRTQIWQFYGNVAHQITFPTCNSISGMATAKVVFRVVFPKGLMVL